MKEVVDIATVQSVVTKEMKWNPNFRYVEMALFKHGALATFILNLRLCFLLVNNFYYI